MLTKLNPKPIYLKLSTYAWLAVLLFGALCLAGCSAQPAPASGALTPSATLAPSETPVFESGATPVPILLTQAAYSPEPSAIPATTTAPALPPGATAQPTPDLRLQPENWREWPVVPERVSAVMIELYQRGLAAGNDPNAFSKIGDCQNIPNAFLGFFDRPGGYQLIGNSLNQQATIDQFTGSFGRESQAVRGGFNVASVLSPFWADIQACAPGETPLACEFRLHRPSIVFISMETWFPGRTTETYVNYLRQIIEYSLAQNVVPILATKADNTEGNHAINLAIATLAYEYDLPLWNFWRAVQPLKDQGIDWGRDDTGFHITVEAWNVRSFTALAALDSVWRKLNAVESVAAPLPTPTATAVSLAEPPQFDPVTAAGEQVWLSLGERAAGLDQSSGALRLEAAAGQFERLTPPGYRMLDLSTDGRAALLSQGSSLFLLSLPPGEAAEPQAITLSRNFLASSARAALFLPEVGALVYIETPAQPDGTTMLMLYQAETGRSARLNAAGETPTLLYPSQGGTRLYWENAACDNSYANCRPLGVHSTDWRTLDSQAHAEIQRPAVGLDGSLAYVAQSADGQQQFMLLAPGAAAPRTVLTTENVYEYYRWSPDGKTLLIIEADQSDYSNLVLGRRYLLLAAADLSVRILNVDEQYRATLAVWSPDSQRLLLFGLELQAPPLRLLAWQVEPATALVSPLPPAVLPWGEQFPYLQGVFWLP